MSFDIHCLNNLEYDPDSELFQSYIDTVQELFWKSKEGVAYKEANSNIHIGYWIRNLMELGFGYHSSSVPQMDVAIVKDIVAELFPAKITLNKASDADSCIPELLTFWNFLQKEYQLQEAEAIIKYLRNIQPVYRSIMNDPSKFGMAKSLMVTAREAGFPMETQADMENFLVHFNRKQLGRNTEIENDGFDGSENDSMIISQKPNSFYKKRNNAKKISKESKKKNRKRK